MEPKANIDFDMDECPVHYALTLLGGKWKLLIVWVLAQQDCIRFNELQRNLDGISAIMLSKNLQELEADGIVDRKKYDVIPPKVEYSLSDLGKQIKPALETLGMWGIEAYQHGNNKKQ